MNEHPEITEERIAELERQLECQKLSDALYLYFLDEGTTTAVTIAALCADWRARQAIYAIHKDSRPMDEWERKVGQNALMDEFQKQSHCAQEPVAALESPKKGQDSGIDPTKTIYPPTAYPCSTCGQPRGRHHAETLACPIGRRANGPQIHFSVGTQFTP